MLNNYSVGRIGQEMLMEEDYADDEIETELAPIVVQLAYVRQVTVSSYIFLRELLPVALPCIGPFAAIRKHSRSN